MSDEEILKLKKSELVNAVKKIKMFTNESFLKFIENIKDELNDVKQQLKSLKDENLELRNVIFNQDNHKEQKEFERLAYENMQYVRRNNLEISGIPDIFGSDTIEDKVIEICNLYGVEIEKRDIEACHRLKKNDKNMEKYG